MIICFERGALDSDIIRAEEILRDRELEFRKVAWGDQLLLVTPASANIDDGQLQDLPSTASTVGCKADYQLYTRVFQQENTIISLGDGIEFGGNKTVLAAGPCAVESESQVMATAEFLGERLGLKLFRAGAFKPRTSPYSFQGMADEGLKILERVRQDFGMKIITEVKDSTHLAAVAEVADIVQIGTKAMYNPALLNACGQINKPICLKRGFMATIKEFLQAADFILSNGNRRVILCERGVRSFEPQTRFCLDVCSAAVVKQASHLPLMLDPSHAMGWSAQVPDVARSAAALGVDSLMIEVHPNPAEAKSDKDQALSFEEFEKLYESLIPICNAVGRALV